jgi:hypothetical protein
VWYAAKQVDPGANGDLGAKAKALPKADGDVVFYSNPKF